MFKKIVGLGFSTKGKNAKDVEKYIADLVAWGANEFFTWYNPPYWYEKFGFEVSPNGRFAEHEQITDYESLKLIVWEVHKHGFELFINLNAWYYTDVTFPYIKQMVSEFQDLGIDGIICGNIGILEYLKSINYSSKINISTIMAVYNTQAIQFLLENYSVNKVILSREVTLREIKNIVTTFPNTKFEVFGEGDFCRYNNGLCFAEHKYWARDICTVVVNDLVFKKKFRADFKKIVLYSSLSDLDKIGMFDDRFEDVFEKIAHILSQIELGFWEISLEQKELYGLYRASYKRVDLFYDALTGPINEKNKKILTYLRGLNYLLKHVVLETENEKIAFLNLQEELEIWVKTGMEYFLSKLKVVGGEPKLKALETWLFYAKWDNLNLYSYLFFSKFPNIETVKFPTRGRSYNEKIKTIAETIDAGEVPKELIDRGISIERSHYDLTYLFGEKLWFRNLLLQVWK